MLNNKINLLQLTHKSQVEKFGQKWKYNKKKEITNKTFQTIIGKIRKTLPRSWTYE